jgi:hypothetical protein
MVSSDAGQHVRVDQTKRTLLGSKTLCINQVSLLLTGCFAVAGKWRQNGVGILWALAYPQKKKAAITICHGSLCVDLGI